MSGPPNADVIGRAVREAEPAVLAAALAHLTGDPRWASGERGEAWFDAAARAIAEPPAANPDPGDAALLEIARAALSPALTDADAPRLRHHLWPQSSKPAIDPAAAARIGLRVTVIGAGMSGIGLAAELVAAGIDVTVLERRDGLGGVWLDNHYPDCGVDTQAFQYAFESMPNAEWTRFDAKRDEILAYLERTADKAGVAERIRFGVDVREARWAGDRWVLRATTAAGPQRIESDVVVVAVGALNRPKRPDLPGLAEFAGPVFHTAEWDDAVDLAGKRVALIGNGSSGTQVGRAIAARAAHLTAFQRTPHWIRPRTGAEMGPVGAGFRWLVENLPFYLGWYRFHLNYVIGDAEHPKMVRKATGDGLVPTEDNDRLRDELTGYLAERLGGREDLIARLTPDYPPYTKRLVTDNGWYDTLTEPHVELVTDAVQEVRSSGIRTVDGRHHDADVLVFATGFHGTRYFWPMEIVGRSGLGLADAHGGAENVRAHLGITMPGYPNLFALQGPNSSVGHGGGVTYLSECQGRYILGCLALMISRGARTVEVRPEVSEAYNAEMDDALEAMVWATDGVGSRYRNSEGRIVMNHPWTIGQFWDLTRHVRPDDLLFDGAP